MTPEEYQKAKTANNRSAMFMVLAFIIWLPIYLIYFQSAVTEWSARNFHIYPLLAHLLPIMAPLVIIGIPLARMFPPPKLPDAEDAPELIYEEALSPHFTRRLKLKPFTSPNSGLALNAPESWIDTSDQKIFQVIDPETNAQFTSSAYENPGQTPEQWATARFDVVAKGMSYLKQVKPPYRFVGNQVSGIAAEYEGIFPESKIDSHYLVLCLHRPERVISVTITASKKTFSENEKLYRWLLQTQLSIKDVTGT